ncbi:hypothetical protein K402DRAFT_369060 [Aulographum hederae CBS 113979]|uniref:UBA domain-containing protein n=1 Tax=Aulographum hederae CBS 113979 TaxID=1176131 RepID=A0A6G1HD58_9PEZI|nr:hypothetical protein K402DRAFT_369060 [Aulographum hederae CBS 113979]
MNDLADLDWKPTAPSSSNPNPNPNPKANYNFPTLQPTPSPSLSGRTTPLSAHPSGNNANSNRNVKAGSKTATPANDSFSGLLNLNSGKAEKNLSLQERQKALLEEKAKQQAAQQAQYGAQNTFWDSLGEKKTEPNRYPFASQPQTGTSNPFSANYVPPVAQGKAKQQNTESEADILAAFDSEAPVDASSHFPVSEDALSRRSTPANGFGNGALGAPKSMAVENNAFDDDDDPFGLGQMSRPSYQAQPQARAPPPADDDDILGMLGKPVTEVQRPAPATQRALSPDSSDDEGPEPAEIRSRASNPRDKAVAELVDMGFPAEKSVEALAQTDSGVNVQAAVGWLLNQAHEEAKQKAKGGTSSPAPARDPRRETSATRPSRGDSSTPAWMRPQPERSGSSQRRQDNRSPGAEKDVSQYASEFGSTLFKSANSLWKTGKKNVQKAVADFQEPDTSGQPKWMREAQMQEAANQSRPAGADPGRRRAPEPSSNVTDEAMMLEGGSRPQKPSRPSSTRPDASTTPFRTQSPASRDTPDRTGPQPKFMQQPHRPQQPVTRRTPQDLIEQESAQAYVSPARRRKVTPPQAEEPRPETRPTPAPRTVPQASPSLKSNNPFNGNSRSPAATSTPPVRSTPIPTRPKAPTRNIPSLPPSALSTSTNHRLAGTASFKRGDYSAAHISYTSALQPLPSQHPVTIILLCNRALTNLKVGDPKAAIADAEQAIAVIGVSRGEGEKIDLGGVDGEKEMKEFFGKALMRRAEAMEHMEKWKDAASAWKEAVEAGVGGAVSIQGRNRCEKAAASSGAGGGSSAPVQPKAKTAPARPQPVKKLATRPAASTAASAEAVKKLREANKAAEAADDEKFALTDQVDAKLTAWKGSKSDNLRALLGSLDAVLWPDAGWKKVGMGELVMPGKVKIAYMKAIAKVHPDKIPQNASTEQKMISAAVFSTLNEAWDKFKKDNNL